MLSKYIEQTDTFHINKRNLYLIGELKIENVVKVKINFTDITKYLSKF